MKIYLDLLFIQDTIVMTCILLIVSKLINTKMNIVRTLIVSAFSSIVSILILIFFPNLFDSIFVKIILSLFIVKCGFRLENSIDTVKKTIVFWIMIFLLGGIHIFSSENILLTTLLGAISLIFIIVQKKKRSKQLLLESMTCYLSFIYNKSQYVFKALVDTGLDVKTEYGESIIFVNENLFKERGGKNQRLVSYRTVSGIENKIGIKIKDVIITYGDKKICSNVVIVSTPNISKNFDAIIGYDLVEGGLSYGNTIFDKAESEKIIS